MSTRPPKKKKAPVPKGPAKRPGGLRTLADVEPARDPSPPRTGSSKKAAAHAIEVLQAEFDHVLMMKEKLAAEASIGAKEKGRESARQGEKLRGLIASLEGMSRFALKMKLITPAESRELYAQAMKKGLYDGWR